MHKLNSISTVRSKINFSLLWPLTLLLLGCYLVPIRIFETDFSKVPGDFGDARFNNYVLEHGHKFLTGQIDNYWDAPFMYPYSNVTALSDNLLGSLPIYSVFRIFGYDRETSFQFWLLTLFILNFICCYWVLVKWTNNAGISATGAYIFAFSILLVGNIYNVQTYPRFIVPFVFYWSWQYLSQKKLKYFLFTLLGIVYQFYCGIYLGFFLIYAILFLFISYVIVYRDFTLFLQFKKFKIISMHLLIILLAGALLMFLMKPYMDVSNKLGMRQFQDVLPTIPTLRSYFFTSSAPVVWSFLSHHGTVLPVWWCHFLFIGALPWLGILSVPIIMISRTIKSGKKLFIAFITLSFLFGFIFSLNINGFTLYKWIFQIPGFASMRGVNRVLNIEEMSFILILVFTAKTLAEHNRFCKWITLGLPLLVVIDNAIHPQEIMRYNKTESQQRIKAVKETIVREYNKEYKAVAYAPLVFNEGEIENHINVMLAAQELNIPCVNAYVGSFPPNYPFNQILDEKVLATWCNTNYIEGTKIQRIVDPGTSISKKIQNIKRIQLKATNEKYVCADGSMNNILIVNRAIAQNWETFSLILFENNECAFFAYNNHFVSAELGSKNELTATREEVKSWETFTLIQLDSGHVAFKAANGKYLSIDDASLQLFAKSDSIGKQGIFEMITP